MKITTTLFVAALFASLVVLPSCSDSTTEPPPDPTDTTTFAFSNVQTDSVVKWLYISLDSMKVADLGSSNWDVRMPYIYPDGRTRSIPVQLNSGTNGPGTTTGAVVSSRFESLAAMPAGTVLRSDDTANPVVSTALSGGPTNTMFVYDAPTRTIRCSPDRTLIVKTGSGKLFKFAVTSLYKDAVSNPTMMTPLGFYHFRIARLPQ
ncbi:MAG: hypothetical protein FGM32_04455 [Candidatus Kapabacteria bacterium]|nr:hypothetical protein [Candidatus Kapabacteria bacterium]